MKIAIGVRRVNRPAKEVSNLPVPPERRPKEPKAVHGAVLPLRP
jgi:hypothetical protein